MEQPTKTVSVAALPQVRVLGRTTGTDVVNLFWTGSGIEFIYTGSEIQVEVNVDYDAYEPWLAVELNGVQISRVPLNKGKNEVCLFRGMTVGKPKHVRILKEVQAMHQDPGHLLQIVGLQYADGEFQQLPEPKYRLEFVGDSITSGEGTVGAVYEEDWWQMHYPQSIVWYLRAAGELSPDGMEMWRIRFLRFTHRSVAYSPGRGMLLWERWKTMISRHGSRMRSLSIWEPMMSQRFSLQRNWGRNGQEQGI